MSVVVQGTLRADGTLELDAKPALPPGRVEVAVHPLTARPPSDPQRFWSMMQGIWADLRSGGCSPRTREEIDAEINALRDESEEEMQAIQGLQANGNEGDGRTDGLP